MTNPVAVLVVGGGPVGLALACELRRHGASCRIVEKSDAPQVWSKAAALMPRTLEVLDDLGVGERARARGRRVHGANLFDGTTRVGHVDLGAGGTPYPFLLGLSQRETELLLAERLGELGGKLERNVTLEGFEQTADRVIARLVRSDGSREVVEAQWLVGCDGARSTVREVLGLPFEGSTFEQNVIQGDVRLDLPVAVDANEAAIFLAPGGLMAALPLFTEGRYRVILPNMPDPDAEANLEVFAGIVAARAPVGTRVHDPAWIARFRFHGRLAAKYRVGRVLLAGDAAHIHSPVGGQGMNMGIQDAYNLGWKLGLVARGRANASLLDSYEPERRPVARATVERTDLGTRTMLRVLAFRSPVVEALRNQAASFLMNSGLFTERAFREVGQLGVSYAASPIVGQHHLSVWSAEVTGDEGASEQPSLAAWLAFARATGPGERVADVDLSLPVEGASTLHELLRGTRHVLFLFDGLAATRQGYENLAEIATRVTARAGDDVRVFLVVPRSEQPPQLSWSGTVILDPDGVLHSHFGSTSEALCLIRPDGHVAFRSQPAELEPFSAYLERIFA